MTDVTCFWVAFVAYLVATFLLAVGALRRGGERLAVVGRGLVWLGMVAQATSIVWRAFVLGTRPLGEFFPRLATSFSAGPAWQAVVYGLLFAVAAVAVGVGVVCRRRRAAWLVTAAVALVLELILLDFLDYTRLPIEKVYEYLSLASWCSAVALLAVSPTLRLVVLDAALALTACLLVVFAAIQPKTIELQLVPALQSYWLFIHVSLTSLGYAVFGMAFIVAAMFLVKSYDREAVEATTRRRAWRLLALAAGVGIVVVLVLVLCGVTLPFKEVAYTPHELGLKELPATGAVQVLRYGAALVGAVGTCAYVVYWLAWWVLAVRAKERERSGFASHLFVITTFAMFAACLLLAGLLRRQENAIARVRAQHAELGRVASEVLPSVANALTAETLDADIERSRSLAQQARRVLASARWLPLTLDNQASVKDDPVLADLVTLYAKAGAEWKLPIRYKDIKQIGRTLGTQARTTEALAGVLRLPADREELARAQERLADEFYGRQAHALLPRTAVGQVAAFIGLALLIAVPLGLVLMVASPRVRDRLPDAARLDRVSYAAIAIAYPVFTFGALFAGAIWAHFAWGTWWGWDPKEVGSLVAWVLYTIYLHQRYREAINPRTAAVAGMLGFLAATLSLAGNAFMGGLHAYS